MWSKGEEDSPALMPSEENRRGCADQKSFYLAGAGRHVGHHQFPDLTRRLYLLSRGVQSCIDWTFCFFDLNPRIDKSAQTYHIPKEGRYVKHCVHAAAEQQLLMLRLGRPEAPSPRPLGAEEERSCVQRMLEGTWRPATDSLTQSAPGGPSSKNTIPGAATRRTSSPSAPWGSSRASPPTGPTRACAWPPMPPDAWRTRCSCISAA